MMCFNQPRRYTPVKFVREGQNSLFYKKVAPKHAPFPVQQRCDGWVCQTTLLPRSVGRFAFDQRCESLGFQMLRFHRILKYLDE